MATEETLGHSSPILLWITTPHFPATVPGLYLPLREADRPTSTASTRMALGLSALPTIPRSTIRAHYRRTGEPWRLSLPAEVPRTSGYSTSRHEQSGF